MRTSSRASVFLLSAIAVMPAAWAASLGPAPTPVALGSPLALSIPVALDEGDALEPECVVAEVTIGERRVPAPDVRWSIGAGAHPRERLVRVATLTVIDEPVVSVNLAMGCGARISRQYTLFPDPPLAAAAPMPVAEGENASAARLPTGSSPQRVAIAPVVNVPAPRSVGAGERRTATPVTTKESRPTRKAGKARRTPADTSAMAKSRPTAPPRLTLEPAEPQLADGSLVAAQAASQASASAMQAASAASLAASAASAAEARLHALELQVEKLAIENQQQRAENQDLRRRVSPSSGSGWPVWTVALIAGLAALALWLAWRLRRVEREARDRWWGAAEAQIRSDLSEDENTSAGWEHHRVRPVQESAASPAAEPIESMGPMAAVLPDESALAEPGWTTMTPPRPVTVEELIDLEQQAEFFVVLGQDDAAIELLVNHIRTSGGISPLPYLKLLEIYRRRNEVESYERIRERFNQRFNGYAPDWNAGLQQGRVLEDYPDVIDNIRHAWFDPARAMSVLGALVFRSDGGPMFDLPAYREVLLLYSLARDLRDTEAAADTHPVDLLLPLDVEFTPDLGAPARRGRL